MTDQGYLDLSLSLKDLLDKIDAGGALDTVPISGATADSRHVKQGDAFFALPGTMTHGAEFAAQAAAKGAAAIVSDGPVDGIGDLPLVIVDDVRVSFAKAMARLWAPQPEVLVGITGTNGKTSIAGYVRQLWAASGISAASVGTLGIETSAGLAAGSLTTPDPETLHKSLHKLRLGGVDHVVMEASSHGLDQRRLDGVGFKAVGYANLSRDHLDYHVDMSEYREAKLRLFRDLLEPDGAAVVNIDDPEHMPFFFAALDRGVTLLTVGTEGAFFEITGVEAAGFSQKVTGKLVGEPVEFVLPLAGRFQVDNAAMAAALAIQTGADPQTTIEALNGLRGARGRLELAGEHNGAAIFVDYSHKPLALESALDTLRAFTRKRLILVFGCGGDRDRGKRPIMGEIAERLADLVIVTDDNPRTEDPAAIRAEILKSAPGAREIGDRAEAISVAVGELRDGDVLLVAGKGHEDYQIVGTTKRHFSDHEEVKKAIMP